MNPHRIVDERSSPGAIGSGLIAGPAALSLDEVERRGRRAAGLLSELGVEAGHCVALVLRNGAAFIEATLGAQHLGTVAVPINWHFTADEIAYVLNDCGARVVIAEADIAGAALIGEVPDRILLTVGGEGAYEWRTRLEAAVPSSAPPAPTVPSMVYTSGTTGKPKGVRRLAGTPAQARAAARVRQSIYDARPGMRVLLAAPLYHSAPNFFALATLRHEGLLVLEQKFDPAATLALIERHRITHLFMVPTMFVRLLALPDEVRARHDLASLRWVLHAGAPCPISVKRDMIDWWGPVLTEYYASTEMGPLTFVDSAEWLARPGTVGRPVEGVTLSIRDEQGRECAPGVAGEVCVGRAVQPDFTYHGDASKREAVNVTGGMATGDIGYLDRDGYLFLCDRKVDLIISGGVNIYPAEIEAAILALAGVRDVAVLGLSDPEFGEKVVAVIETDQTDPDAAAILDAVRGRIAGYKIPRTIRFTERLPRDDSGKVFKRRLKQSLERDGWDRTR